jgi:radical SAM/Cys-rich protein
MPWATPWSLRCPCQLSLEEDYRRELAERFGVTFTHLLTITNMPLGRCQKELVRHGGRGSYMQLLQESFNPATITGLMCRRQVSIGWDGTLYDCDFNLAVGLPVNYGAPDHIRVFLPAELWNRRIMTGEHCFGCTAGAGSSCGGSIVCMNGGEPSWSSLLTFLWSGVSLSGHFCLIKPPQRQSKLENQGIV